MSNMIKEEFFKKFHKELAEKYGLSIHAIEIIRGMSLGENKTKDEILNMLLEKPKQPHHHGRRTKGRRKYARQFYLSLYNFLNGCREATWQNLTQATEYD